LLDRSGEPKELQNLLSIHSHWPGRFLESAC
jgi:hypothetical protein